MTATLLPAKTARRTALAVGLAAMLALAIAMGVGRFAFTPLYPLMSQDGLLSDEGGALLASSNYLGYLVGAMLAARIRLGPAALMACALIGTVIVTAAMGWTTSVPAWAALRFAAGVLSAWALVATSAWGLGWLASLGRPRLAGAVFAGVGLGIAAAGVFCLVAARPGASSLDLWIALAGLTGIAAIFPLITLRRLPRPAPTPAPTPASGQASGPTADKAASPAHAHGTAHPLPIAGTRGLIVCYGLFGVGYILPATYLPALARNLVDDPRIFGLAWPVFGAAAALSTLLVARVLKNANRLNVWALSQLLMAVGVLLPVIWASLVSMSVAALLVGGTFMVITMVAMQEAQARAGHNPTAVLGRMTAGFALGQLLGPVVSATISHFSADFFSALDYAMSLAGAGLLFSSFYLWREAQRHACRKKESS